MGIDVFCILGPKYTKRPRIPFSPFSRIGGTSARLGVAWVGPTAAIEPRAKPETKTKTKLIKGCFRFIH
jgi:hypothetical protein